MKRGTTQALVMDLDVDLSLVNQIIFTLKSIRGEIIQKYYPIDTLMHDDKMYLLLSQAETDGFSGDIFIEGQINFNNGSVGKTETVKKRVEDSLFTQIIDGSAPTIESNKTVKLALDGDVLLIGGGEGGGLYVPIPTAPTENTLVLKWKNNAGMPNPEPITILAPTGETGAKGEKGLQGAKGDTGGKGDIGAVGAQGLRGLQGLKGDTGAPGGKGDAGAQGVKGDKGDPGTQGASGDKGDTGAQGLQGLQGLKGESGAASSKGDKGDPGATGPQGDPGIKGDKGEAGSKGEVGATGAQGLPGAKGDTGTPGESYLLTPQDKIDIAAIIGVEFPVNTTLAAVLGGGA